MALREGPGLEVNNRGAEFFEYQYPQWPHPHRNGTPMNGERTCWGLLTPWTILAPASAGRHLTGRMLSSLGTNSLEKGTTFLVS